MFNLDTYQEELDDELVNAGLRPVDTNAIARDYLAESGVLEDDRVDSSGDNLRALVSGTQAQPPAAMPAAPARAPRVVDKFSAAPQGTSGADWVDFNAAEQHVRTNRPSGAASYNRMLAEAPLEAPPSALEQFAANPRPSAPYDASTQGAASIASGQAPQRRYINAPPPVRENDDKTGMILATFLDMLMNKGRNLGVMTGAMLSPGKDVAFENWKRNAQAEQLNAQIADKYETRQTGNQTLSPTQQSAAYRLEQQKQRDDANSELSREIAAEYARQLGRDPAELVGKVSANQIGEMRAGFTNEMHANRAAKNREAGGQEWDRRQEQQFRDWARRHNISEEDLRARAMYEDALKAGAEDRKFNREADVANAPIPGLVVGDHPEDQAAWTGAMRDPTTRKKAEDAAAAYTIMNENLRKMAELRAKYGAELPGEVQAEYDGYKTLAIGGITTLAQTGVLNGGEYERYSQMIPGTKPRWWDITQGFGLDVTADQLEGVARAIRASTDFGLQKWGARYESPEDRVKRRGASQPATPQRKPKPKPKTEPVTDDELEGMGF